MKFQAIAFDVDSSRRTSDQTLKLTGFMPFIDTVISKEDVDYSELKPHPPPIENFIR